MFSSGEKESTTPEGGGDRTGGEQVAFEQITVEYYFIDKVIQRLNHLVDKMEQRMSSSRLAMSALLLALFRPVAAGIPTLPTAISALPSLP